MRSAALQAEGITAKSGRPLDKGDVYKLLNLRTYISEVTHKGRVYPGEHQGIVPRALWDRAHDRVYRWSSTRVGPEQVDEELGDWPVGDKDYVQVWN